MPFLVIDGYETVPVRVSAPLTRLEQVGSVRRAFSGVPRSSVRAYFRVWPVETDWVPRERETALIAALLANPPLTIEGDMPGYETTGVVDQIRRVETGRLIVDGVNTEVVRLAFELLEEVAAGA